MLGVLPNANPQSKWFRFAVVYRLMCYANIIIISISFIDLYCVSSDFSDLPDMTVERIDVSVPHTSCFSLYLTYIQGSSGW